jgi:hypothetical protein
MLFKSKEKLPTQQTTAIVNLVDAQGGSVNEVQEYKV